MFRFSTIRRLGAVLGLSTFLLGCTILLGCTSDESVNVAERDASVYRAVITDLGERSGQSFEVAEGEVPVVFIETLGSEAIALDTQVEVIAKLADTYEIRFIDDLGEAVELELDGWPVRSNSMLIGLGPIQVGDGAEVRGEVYLRADEIRAFRYSLVSLDGSGWKLAGPPEEAEPEGFQPTP